MSMPSSAQRWEMLGKWLWMNAAPRWLMSQVHAVQAQPFHLVIDGARHHIAWREFSFRMERVHEALPIGQAQHAAFAAHHFRYEKAARVGVI